MNKKEEIKTGKYISYLLRHNPEDLEMSSNGWVKVKDLLKKANISMTNLEQIVDNNNKKRYIFDDYKMRIRANQGHSIDVDVELEEATPPEFLYHGTSDRNINSIFKSGLKKMNRNHVHLSADIETAKNVGKRHGGNLVIFSVYSESMLDDGIRFFLSENGVWLTDYVSPDYIEIFYEKD